MDDKDNRRTQLRRLIDERFDGVAARLAIALDMKPPQLHRWLSGRQGISEESARAIERKLGLDRHWLDRTDADLSPSSNGHPDQDAAQSHTTPSSTARGVAATGDAPHSRGGLHELPILTYGDIMDGKHHTPHAAQGLRPTVPVRPDDASEHCFAVAMPDNTMMGNNPPLPKGMIVIFDPQRAPAHECVVLVHEPGKEPMTRQYLKDGDDAYICAPGTQIPPRRIDQGHVVAVARGAYYQL